MRLAPTVDEILDQVVEMDENPLDPETQNVEKGKRKTFKEIMSNAGASPEEAAGEIRRIMKFGDNDSIRLKAAETVLKIQGLQAELEKETDNSAPTVEITIVASQNANLVDNLLLPRD